MPCHASVRRCVESESRRETATMDPFPWGPRALRGDSFGKPPRSVALSRELQCSAAVWSFVPDGDRSAKEWDAQSIPVSILSIHRSRSPTRATSDAYGGASRRFSGLDQPAAAHWETAFWAMRFVKNGQGARSRLWSPIRRHEASALAMSSTRHAIGGAGRF